MPALPSIFNKNSAKLLRPDTKKVLNILGNLIGTTGWFISGSFANIQVGNPKDIDIFFTSKTAYDNAVNRMTSRDGVLVGIQVVTDNALTFYVENVGDIQFIHKYFGTPREIFKTFDLNVCKKAIMPSGALLQDDTANSELHICNINGDTFNRYFKYAKRLYSHHKIMRLGKQLVDNYILDDTLVEYFYDNVTSIIPTNQLLLEATKHYPYIKHYALEQARLKAPELLL